MAEKNETETPEEKLEEKEAAQPEAKSEEQPKAEGSEEEQPADDFDVDAFMAEITGEPGEKTAEDEGDEPSSDTGKPDATPESGEETPKVPPVDVGKLFDESPEFRSAVGNIVAQQREDEKAAERRSEAEKEISTLIEAEDYPELGKRVATELQKTRSKREVSDEVLTEFLGPLFKTVLGDEIFQTLTAEEKLEIDPRRFRSDHDFTVALFDMRQRKAVAKAVADATTEKQGQEATATENADTGEKVKSAARHSLPSGQPVPKDEPKKASDMIAAGWGEILSGAGYNQDEE